MRPSVRRLLAWLRCLGLLPTPPPVPSHAHFPVKSLKQLGFFVERKRRHFYFLYGKRGKPLALSIWPRKGQFAVCREPGFGRVVVSRRDPASFLARAIAESRLYVSWDI
jgi:hypothetical protein